MDHTVYFPHLFPSPRNDMRFRCKNADYSSKATAVQQYKTLHVEALLYQTVYANTFTITREAIHCISWKKEKKLISSLIASI